MNKEKGELNELSELFQLVSSPPFDKRNDGWVSAGNCYLYIGIARTLESQRGAIRYAKDNGRLKVGYGFVIYLGHSLNLWVVVCRW